MRLGVALLKRRHIIPGFKWTGKHRMPHRIYQWNIESMERRLQVEDKNLFYLRHPYLTVEQELGSTKDFNKHENWLMGKMLLDAACRVKPSVRMEDRLAHLNIANAWEV